MPNQVGHDVIPPQFWHDVIPGKVWHDVIPGLTGNLKIHEYEHIR